ncbi:hypothetical protein QBC35DRAFT_451965 [Podospora australis]|uniref:Uncharacterized protein n=1 Tax=Podospora australis TaxID=1536484 RepID=A0AAN7AIC5_9PEZI|nr:hypothetical protein QBC35DRAFT_451965 [Podospora australis]
MPTIVTSTVTPVCRYTTSTARIASTARATTTSSPGVRTTVVTVTAPPASTPQASGAWTFTISGSTCVGSPPGGNGGGGGWGGGGWGGGGWGGGRGGGWGPGGGNNDPPAWITSAWGQGGGQIPPWVSCSRRRPGRRSVGPETPTITSVVVETVTLVTALPMITVCSLIETTYETITLRGPVLTVLSLFTTVSQVPKTIFATKTVLTISNDPVASTACARSGGVYGLG